MILKHNLEIDTDIVKSDITRIINQIYKLLPTREEKSDWIKPL